MSGAASIDPFGDIIIDMARMANMNALPPQPRQFKALLVLGSGNQPFMKTVDLPHKEGERVPEEIHVPNPMLAGQVIAVKDIKKSPPYIKNANWVFTLRDRIDQDTFLYEYKG